MCVEHQVHAIPPGEKKSEFVAAFDIDRWQWAQKLAKFLEDKGHTEVKVTLENCDDETEDEED